MGKNYRPDAIYFFYIINMNNDLKEKIKASFKNGYLSKILLIIVTAIVSFYPFISIQTKLNESIGNQPKIISVSYIFIAALAIFLIWIVMKTRPEKK